MNFFTSILNSPKTNAPKTNAPSVSWSSAVEDTKYEVLPLDGVQVTYNPNINETEPSGVFEYNYKRKGVYWLVFDKFKVSVLYPEQKFLVPVLSGGRKNRRNTRRNRKNRKQRKSSRRRRTSRR